MNRRRVLGLGALAGLSAVGPIGVRSQLYGGATDGAGADDVAPYTGKFFMMIHAGGGWDPTMLCDPKGGAVNRGFAATDFGHSGHVTYAPVRYRRPDGTEYFSNQQFFEKFASRLLVVNGIDMSTNNHDTGTRFTWTGRLEDGYPPLAGLIAAALAPGRPLGFMSNGGYDNTAGVVPLARLSNLDAIARVAFPNRSDPAKPDQLIHSAATYARIQRAQAERLAAMADAQTLPNLRDSMRQLLRTRAGSNMLERMMQFAPTGDELRAAANQIYYQGLVALAGYRAGIAAAVNMEVGGFDTHGDHDNRQASALGTLLSGVNMLMDKIDALGLTDKVVVVIGSDFGRTPVYNAQNGKDHWAVTSLMMMGPGVPADRVVGGTDEALKARAVDARTLQPIDGSGSKITPRTIHRALRRYAGIESSEIVQRFPIMADDLPLLG